MLQLADGIGGETFGVFLLLLDFLYGDKLRRVGAGVAKVDDGICTFTKLLACYGWERRGRSATSLQGWSAW